MLVTHLCVGVIIIPILEGVRKHTIYINTIYIKAFQRNLEGFFYLKTKTEKQIVMKNLKQHQVHFCYRPVNYFMWMCWCMQKHERCCFRFNF